MADGYGMADAAARLGQAVTALADVRSRMAASMRRAEYWRDEYAGHDLAGLGRSCEQIRAAAEAVHNLADTMITGVGTHTAALATVTDTTAPDQVLATLTPIEQVLAQLATDCLAGATRCTDLATLIARNLAGGKPEWLHDQAAHASTHFTQTHAHLAAAADLVAAAITQAHEAGTAQLSSNLGPPSQTEAHVGEPLPDPDERLGARIHQNTNDEARDKRSRRRNRLSRIHESAVENGDDVASKFGTIGDQIRAALTAKDPTMCIDLSQTKAVQLQPTPPPVNSYPDMEHSAGSIIDTMIFIGDIIVHTYRKARRRG